MKRFTYLMIIILFSGIVAGRAAQIENEDMWENTWRHQIEVEIGLQIPSDTYLDNSGSLGATYYYRASKHFFLSGGISFQSFAVKNTSIKVSVIPVTVGFKYNFITTGTQPYIGAELGSYMLGVDNSSNNYTYYNENHLGLMLKAGLRIPVTMKMDIDVNFKYHMVDNSGLEKLFYGLNVGMAFSL